MTELVDSLSIHGFRGFSELDVNAFGKVNLITGKNNSGKSSLLEAIRILVTRGSMDTIQSILNYREETNEDMDRDHSEMDFGPYRHLFTGFPDLGSGPAKFVINASGRISSVTSAFSLSTLWARRLPDTEKGTISYEPAIPDLFGDPGGVPALEMLVDGRRRVFPLDNIRRRFTISQFGGEALEAVRCVYLDSFSSRTTGRLGVLWDAIALTDSHDEVVKALQLISPDIQAVSMIGGGDSRLRSRTAIVRSRQSNSPIPLRTFGDGVNRLFGIILSLCNAKSGVLLIDEFENGLHHSVQTSIWKTIFRLANDLNVQVFTTSHSHDCVKAFQEAAADSHWEGVLIRLTRKDDKVLPTVFRERELEIATRNEIEVR
jgi:ABC-type phosphonate transport system ATPase subunit